MMTWNRDTNMIVFESIVSSKKLYLQNAERVMILNCFRINCIIRRLHSSCDWLSNIFSLYDLFETWSFDMTVRVNCFIKNCIYRTLNASRYRYDCSSQLYRQKICICLSSISIRFCCMICSFCHCRCSISWYVNFSETFFLFLVWAFSNSETKRQRINVLNILMWWIHFLNILNDWRIFIFDVLLQACKLIDFIDFEFQTMHV